MASISELRKERDGLRRARGRVLDDLADKHSERRKLIKAINHKRDRRDEAESDARREALADLIDNLVGERKRIEDRLESLDARLGNIKAALRRAVKRVKKAARKLRKGKHYASPSFAFAEFDCNNGTPIPEAAKPALRHLCENYLEPLRAKYGTVHINSGYRTAAYNASVGGATNSIHIYDQHPGAVAADHWCDGASPAAVYAFDNSRSPGGLGSYATFTHIDNRQLIGWATARWSG